MSFNNVEVARVVDELKTLLPDEVQGAELVRFPLKAGTVPDINVALRLKNARQLLVFSLKQPWTGVFLLPPQRIVPAATKTYKPIWATAFNGCEGPAQDWNAYIQSQTLVGADVVPNDRVVILTFENGATLRVELFPSRPNWILTAGGQEFRWRSSLPARPPAAGTSFTAREFEGLPGAEWMDRAYEHYLRARQAVLLQTQVQRGATQLQAKLTKLIRIRGQMEGAMAEVNRSEKLKAEAELLKAKLYELPVGHKASAIEGVELDKRYTVADNVTRMFSRYKKLQRTRKEVEARLKGIEEENKRITSSIAKVRTFKGDYPEFLKLAGELGLELEEPGVEGKKPTKESKKWDQLQSKSGVRRFQSQEGLAIWVGKNHKENEELVIRLARGNDLWMHLKGRPGAHVVIQMPGGKSPSLETLLDAATLVAYYSGVSDKEKVEVDYTFRKYVKRVPGGGDKFLVTYTQNKTLMLKMEDARLWRLLKQH